MKVHAEAKPLNEPLPGGTRGTTVSIEPFVAGHVEWSRHLMESPGGRLLKAKLMRALLTGEPSMKVPCPAFLIRHPSAGPVLVDTGLHPSIAADPAENFGGLGARFGKPSLEPGADVPSRLRERGIDPSELPLVVMTHLHLDHTSAIAEFPNSTFVISEVEWRFATAGPSPALNGYRRAHFDYAFDYRTIDFDRGNVDSYATFGRSFDLFGDGSVRLAYTPGHSAGHMSVVARLEEHDFVIGGDAVYTAAQLDGTAPLAPRPFDRHNYKRSLQELRLFRREFPSAIVTPGHDPSFYEKLGARYD
ncbi:MAG TPA: N-acyl homoserine lactonase family protein [Solirubrobacterales bacterium]|nr:N-acyl homoserine lactonase family protein [Solirubrobacterales bacterium]